MMDVSDRPTGVACIVSDGSIHENLDRFGPAAKGAQSKIRCCVCLPAVANSRVALVRCLMD